MARTSKRSTVSTDPVASLAEQVAALTAMVAALAANQGTISAPNPTPTPAKVVAPKQGKGKGKAAPKGAKVYSWKPWACAKFGIPSTVGASFAYSGKQGTTDHIVTAVSADGIVSSVRA